MFAACDVGQGDALVLRAGEGSAVVVDAGPDPRTVDACLRRLGVDRVPSLVLTHFHADHVDGIAGVIEGREVGAVEGTGLLEPSAGVREVEAALGHDARPATYGVSRSIGEVTVQAVWPRPGSTADPAENTEPSRA